MTDKKLEEILLKELGGIAPIRARNKNERYTISLKGLLAFGEKAFAAGQSCSVAKPKVSSDLKEMEAALKKTKAELKKRWECIELMKEASQKCICGCPESIHFNENESVMTACDGCSTCGEFKSKRIAEQEVIVNDFAKVGIDLFQVKRDREGIAELEAENKLLRQDNLIVSEGENLTFSIQSLRTRIKELEAVLKDIANCPEKQIHPNCSEKAKKALSGMEGKN